MRAVIQRVKSASVSLEGEEISRIEAGFLVLLAVKEGDTVKEAIRMADKIVHLRVLEDQEGKMNRSLLDEGNQSVLLVSQFTLYGDAEKGNRPSFIKSARPEIAKPLVGEVGESILATGIEVKYGAFGEHMQVTLVNDGPTTIILET